MWNGFKRSNDAKSGGTYTLKGNVAAKTHDQHITGITLVTAIISPFKNHKVTCTGWSNEY